jgi:hypothetical protein
MDRTIWVPGFDCRRGLGNFPFTAASRTTLEPTQPPIQWVLGALSLGIKRPGREADHSPPSSAEIKECVELHLHSPYKPSWRGTQLKHRHNFTFTLPPMNLEVKMVKRARAFRRTQSFISAFIKVRHKSISRATSIRLIRHVLFT